jgi:hypothetical protein
MGLCIERNDAYSEYAVKLDSIDEELHTQPVTKEMREHIIQELNEVHESLFHLKTTAVQVNRFAQSFLEELRQKAVFLYGEIDDFYYKHELEVIQHQTEILAQTLQEHDMGRVSQLADALKCNINQLLESYSPLLQERRILVLARLTLEQAEAFLNGQLSGVIDLNEWAFLEAESIIQEIYEHLSNNDRGNLRLLMQQLTASQKRVVMAYFDPKDLIASLLHDVEGTANNDQLFAL